MAVKNLTPEQISFIQENKGKMKIKDIAKAIGVTPPCIHKRLKQDKVVDGFFNEKDFFKQYTA